jgi:WD40 repeat protein
MTALYDLETKKVRAKLEGHNNFVETLAFSPDSKMLVTAGSGLPKKVYLWDTESGERRHELICPGVKAAAFSPDRKTVALVNDRSPHVALFDTASGKRWAVLQSADTTNWSVAFSPDGRTVVTGCSNGTCKIWDVPRREKPAPPR